MQISIGERTVELNSNEVRMLFTREQWEGFAGNPHPNAVASAIKARELAREWTARFGNTVRTPMFKAEQIMR